MPDISFAIPSEIRFGLDVINRIGSVTAGFGERVLLVTEAILYEGKTIDRIQGLFEKKGLQFIVFDEVVPNAASSVIDDGVNLARGSHAEVVVGMGGVRVLSVAKCIAMVAPGSSEMDDYLSGMQPAGEPLPYIAVPTTCRDPFLLSDEYLVTDARDRVARIGGTQKGITRIALFDPKLCSSLPAKYSATTLMDTLLAAIEGFISSKANFLSDTFLQQAIQLIGKTLNLAVEQPDDLKTRMNASTAGLLLALGLTMSRPGIGSALAYAINGRFMVPKSWVATILLPHVLEFNLTAASEKLAVVARILGEDAEEADPVKAASRGVEVVRRFIGTLGLATRLRDFDLKLDDMVDIAGTARSYDMMNFLPRSISTEDLYDLIKTAF